MNKSWILVAVVSAVFFVRWIGSSGGDANEDGDAEVLRGSQTILSQLWLDTIPTAPTQKVEVFVAVDEPQFGVFQRTSAYEGDFALLEWGAHTAGKLSFKMLQTGSTHKLKYKITTSGCEPFELCLKIKGAPRGSKTYGSMKEWVIETVSPAEIEQQVRATVFSSLVAP
jgi:hypothetical protein